MTIRVNLEPK